MGSDIKRIGKIASARYGMGGYQDAMFGASFTLSGDGWGCGDFWGQWASYPEEAKYTEDEWREGHARTVTRIRNLMREAKVEDFAELAGKPIEATFDGNALFAWRILTEVL